MKARSNAGFFFKGSWSSRHLTGCEMVEEAVLGASAKACDSISIVGLKLRPLHQKHGEQWRQYPDQRYCDQ